MSEKEAQKANLEETLRWTNREIELATNFANLLKAQIAAL